jgi:hypothetical protein
MDGIHAESDEEQIVSLLRARAQKKSFMKFIHLEFNEQIATVTLDHPTESTFKRETVLAIE